MTFDSNAAVDRLSRNAWLHALQMTAPIAQNPLVTLPVLIDGLAEKFGDATALISESECVSYRGLAAMVNRYARWALRQGLSAGDVVALLMPNCPTYMAIWLGITRAGGIVSLINTNLAQHALAHSLNAVAPKHVIAAAELSDELAGVLPLLQHDTRCWIDGGARAGFTRIDQDIAEHGDDALRDAKHRPPSIGDRALYIYTSGTTGLPKAANVSHFRLMQWSHWFAGMMDIRPSDRMYNCLPMYHSIGGVVATGATLIGGGSVLIRQRFSVSQFWDEIVGWDCTLFQYIGELCRYLVNSEPHPLETKHRLRLCCGNGLRADIWQEFKSRFRIPHILEYYAATEGTFSLYNCEGAPGAIGRIPGFLAHRFPIVLVKFDGDSGMPWRNDDGFCVPCAADEPGEAISRVTDDARNSAGRFEGYSDKRASDQKILRNVFAHGDAWYRTGDLMRRDEHGYFYFVDRIGDTFRWKGENVSTAEVADVIAACPGVVEAVVFGAAVPGTDGRVGMAAVVVDPTFDLAAAYRHIADRLPTYARPQFLRICAALDTTATFKPKKHELLRDGYDPALVRDPLYFDDRASQAFVRLDAALHARIQSGDIRL